MAMQFSGHWRSLEFSPISEIGGRWFKSNMPDSSVLATVPSLNKTCSNSGCGPAWSGRLFWKQEIGGSNPLSPTYSPVAQLVEATAC